MKARILPALILSIALAWLYIPFVTRAAAARPDDETEPASLVGRVSDTGFIQLRAESFKDLSLDRKMDAYWLARAAIAINPIAYDQNSAYGLREKHLLEA